HAIRRSPQDTLKAGGFQRSAHSTKLIVDRQYLRGVGKDLHDLAHDTRRRDDRHVRLNAILRSFIQVQNARLLAATGADDLGRDRGIDILLFECEQGLNTARHASILRVASVFNLHAVNLGAQLPIFPANTAKISVAIPGVVHPFLGVYHSFFDRSDCGDRPQAEQAGIAALSRAVYLHSQSNNLGEQNGRQHNQVLIAAEECVHTLRCFGKRKPWNCHDEGSEASASAIIETGSPVSSRMRLSRFFNSAPPPVSTMPRSLMSADNSGGVRSRATRMAFISVETHSLSDSRISLSSIVMVLGTPSIRLRPLISMVSGLSSGEAGPISILICSAVRSPISRLYLRFRKFMMDSSI